MCACTLKKEHSWQVKPYFSYLEIAMSCVLLPHCQKSLEYLKGLKDEATASISYQQIHDMMYVMHDIMYVMHGSLYRCMYIVHCIVQCK